MDRKLKFILVSTLIFIVFVGTGVFMLSKFAYKNKGITGKLNVKKNVSTAINNGKEKKINADMKLEDDRQEKLKKFTAEGNNTSSVSGCSNVNTSQERAAADGDIDFVNISDLYDKQIVSLDDMFRIEDRLKSSLKDMNTTYSAVMPLVNNNNELNAYISDKDNRSRISYNYGICTTSYLKTIIPKLAFANNDIIETATIDNIAKKDNNNISFNLNVKTKNNKSHMFSITVNFQNDKKVLNYYLR